MAAKGKMAVNLGRVSQLTGSNRCRWARGGEKGCTAYCAVPLLAEGSGHHTGFWKGFFPAAGGAD